MKSIYRLIVRSGKFYLKIRMPPLNRFPTHLLLSAYAKS